MLFDLPLLPSRALEHIYEQDCINSVYSSLGTDVSSDARVGGSPDSVFSNAHFLTKLNPKTSLYLTMNGRMSAVNMYSDESLDMLYARVRQLADSFPAFKGLIFLDVYLLKRLGQRFDMSFCEAVPSVNCGIDTVKKLNVFMKTTLDLGYKKAGKIIPDRSLNHDLKGLEAIRNAVDKYWTGTKIEILVNEGCIYSCPFKVNHDIVISQMNDRIASPVLQAQDNPTGFDLGMLNEKYGCIDHFKDHPSELLRMPFVRPEDVHHFEGLADILKLSGKIKGPEFLNKCFQAYKAREFEGNLLELLDATENVKHQEYIFNDMIPAGFFDMLSTCNKNCHSCNYCEKVMDKVSQKVGQLG